ncbi:MAG: zinc-ribbon domain-containing protein [Candidatus Heimdallarchaeota archaeon]|nr:zinc-ribbon domain-containing protein [Candidatus Heimdallarchaeota archaeon]
MRFCGKCGTQIDDDSVSFCPSCGESLESIEEKQKEQLLTQLPTESKIVMDKPELIRRNYLIWFLLSLATGIFSIVYLYFNFEDLNRLDKYRENPEVPSTHFEADQLTRYLILMFVLGLFFVIPGLVMNLIIKKKKYDLLYNYLRYSPTKQKTMPISGKKYLNLSILTAFLILVGSLVYFLYFIPFISGTTWLYILLLLVSIASNIGGIVCAIFLRVHDYHWQQAYNERVLLLNPNAREVLLL